MARFATAVIGGTIVTADGGEIRADIGIEDGRIAAIERNGTITGDTTIDAAGRYVLPGLIDPHLHIGLGNGLADWTTETRSAALGGVTTVLTYLMAGSDYTPIYEENRKAADAAAIVDYGFHAVPCTPEHLGKMDFYVNQLGIGSYKFFTSFRGDEGAYLGIAGTDDGYLFDYLREVARHPGVVACVHPENIEIVWRLRQQLQAAGRDGLPAWDESRPDYVEAECILRTMYYARQAGAPIYIVHLSGIEPLNAAKLMRGSAPDKPAYFETCPHYLTHTKFSYPGGMGKVNPPLRTDPDREALWQGLLDGTIDTIGSDHVPRQRAKKQGSIWTASAGFPGTACILPVLLSEGVHKRGMPLSRVVELTARNPANIFGLGNKGSITLGNDADFCVINLDEERTVQPEMFGSFADYSLYDGWMMKGWPALTMLRGSVVMRGGEITAPPGYGKFLFRGEHQ